MQWMLRLLTINEGRGDGCLLGKLFDVKQGCEKSFLEATEIELIKIGLIVGCCTTCNVDSLDNAILKISLKICLHDVLHW